MIVFDIIFACYLSFRNGVKARLKGKNPIVWGVVTFLAYFMAMMFGLCIVIVYFCKDVINLTQLSSLDVKSRDMATQRLLQEFAANPLHSITIYLFAIGGYLFVRYILDRKPDKKEPEIHWMDKMGKSE